MIKSIITISRQYGSGGRKIGEMLAKDLGIPFYDRELIILAAQKSGIDKKVFEDVDEQATNSLLYSLAVGAFSTVGSVASINSMPLNDRLFIAQSDVIKKLALDGPCVIVGRCADYILRGTEHAVNVFIHSDTNNRIQRAIKSYGIPEDKAESVVHKIDKKRCTYHSYYAAGNWGDSTNYDLCIDSGKIGLENSKDIIKDYVLKKESL